MGVAESREILLVGRLIVGAGIGLASMSVPMYISEASPPHLRGLLVSCNVLVITFGQFVAACVCGAFSETDRGWKYMLGLAAIPSALQVLTLWLGTLVFLINVLHAYLLFKGKSMSSHLGTT